MPIATIVKSIYPKVPQVAGVPALLRSGATILDTITLGYLGIGKALTSLIGAEPVKWGVFDAKGVKIPCDSFVAFAYQNDCRISDYPVEKGAFASYNKVETPYEVVVTLIQGGSEDDRRKMIKGVETARKSLDLYKVTVPEGMYPNINFTTVAIQRSIREGANVIIATLSGREVRQKATAAYSAPKSVAASPTQAQGQVQAVAAPAIKITGPI